MSKHYRTLQFQLAMLIAIVVVPSISWGYDLRGVWVGKAKGSVFGAEGSVTILEQKGENILGLVEGGNMFGSAKFKIRGKIRGNQIVGRKAGNVFQGLLYSDGTIRGNLKAVDGDTYTVFLRRKADPMRGYYPHGYGYPYGQPYQQGWGYPYGGSWVPNYGQ